MAQISKGDTFVDGQQVTGARLNQLVDSSVLLVGAITDQPSITANTLEATDTTIVNDAGVLKEATIGDILNSNLAITTSSINGVSGVDITVTPASGRKFDVNGAFEADSINSIGNSTSGSSTIGTLTVTGSSTLTGNVTADNAFTSNGIANFTGSFRINGTTGYVLCEVTTQTMTSWSAPSAGFFSAVWTSSSFTKPSDEVWVFEIDATHDGVYGYDYEFAFRYGSKTARSGEYLTITRKYSSGVTSVYSDRVSYSWLIPAGTAVTSDTVTVDAYAGNGTYLRLFSTSIPNSNITNTYSGTIANSSFRIYKYKTA